MDEEDQGGFIQLPRDNADIAKELDLSTPGTLLDELPKLLAELGKGYLKVGNKGVLVSLGNVVQAGFAGHVMEQLRTEFGALRDAGKLPRDYSNKRYARKTWVDLIRIIDEESPDEDRLDALKAIFYAVNRINADDNEQILAYQLWDVTKRLDSADILLVKTFQQHIHRLGGLQPQQWFEQLASLSGLGLVEMVQLHNAHLLEFKLLKEAHPPGGTANFGTQMPNNAPKIADLTTMGHRLCTNIQTYRTDVINAKGDGTQ